jgi:hypothetical protein
MIHFWQNNVSCRSEADQNSINSKSYSIHPQNQITVKSAEKGQIWSMKHMDKAHYFAFILKNFSNTTTMKRHTKRTNYFLLKLWSECTRVGQKVMPHIFFLGNYLIRMYEIHAQYNWMFPLHMLFFHIISVYIYSLMPVRIKGMHAFPVPAHFLFT